jgi:hypothetical protein
MAAGLFVGAGASRCVAQPQGNSPVRLALLSAADEKADKDDKDKADKKDKEDADDDEKAETKKKDQDREDGEKEKKAETKIKQTVPLDMVPPAVLDAVKKEVPGGTITKAELVAKKDKIMWSFDVKAGDTAYEVKITVEGKFQSKEVDDEKDEKDEKPAKDEKDAKKP